MKGMPRCVDKGCENFSNCEKAILLNGDEKRVKVASSLKNKNGCDFYMPRVVKKTEKVFKIINTEFDPKDMIVTGHALDRYRERTTIKEDTASGMIEFKIKSIVLSGVELEVKKAHRVKNLLNHINVPDARYFMREGDKMVAVVVNDNLIETVLTVFVDHNYGHFNGQFKRKTGKT